MYNIQCTAKQKEHSQSLDEMNEFITENYETSIWHFNQYFKTKMQYFFKPSTKRKRWNERRKRMREPK